MAIIRTQRVLDGETLVWDDTAMSGTAERVTEALDLIDVSQHAQQRPINEVGYLINWTNDATVVGIFAIQVTNTPADSGSWVAAGLLAINNEAGPQLLEAATALSHARLVYTNTSGTGTLGVTTVTGKRSAGQVLPLAGGMTLARPRVTIAGADVADIEVTGLDGNAHGHYIIRAYLINGGTDPGYLWYPNGSVAAASASRFLSVNNALAVTGSDSATMGMGGSAEGKFYVEADVFSAVGVERIFHSDYFDWSDAGTVNVANSVHATQIWDDTVANLTSIKIHSDETSIAAGSFLEVWR